MAKNRYLHMQFYEKHYQKISLAQRIVVHMAILITFAFRSKRRQNE